MSGTEPEPRPGAEHGGEPGGEPGGEHGAEPGAEPRRPMPRTGLSAAAAALLAIAVAVGIAIGGGDGGDAPGASGPSPSSRPDPTPTASASPSAPQTPTPTPSAPAAPATPTPAPSTAAPPAPDPAPADDGGAAPPGQTVVPPRQVPELPPVPLTADADFGTEVAARLTDVARVDGEGQGLGEESGPALAVTVQMDNGTAEAVDLSFVVVNLVDAAGNPGQALFGDPRSEPFAGPLAPGGSATATYVLRLPADDTDQVTVTVSYGAEAPTAVFSGPVPAGGAQG